MLQLLNHTLDFAVDFGVIASNGGNCPSLVFAVCDTGRFCLTLPINIAIGLGIFPSIGVHICIVSYHLDPFHFSFSLRVRFLTRSMPTYFSTIPLNWEW